LDGATATTSSGTAELEYFNARHMSAVLGSFTQPDPMQAGADFLNPQSWNGYAYVLGNPLGLVDPSGMDTIYSGIQNGVCPASQQTCGPPGGSYLSVSSAGLPNDLETGYQSYAAGVAQSFFISKPSAVITFPDINSSQSVSFDAIFQSVLSSWILGLNGSSIGSDPGGPGGRTPGGPAKSGTTPPLQPTRFRVAIPFWQNPLPKYCGPGTGSGAPVNQVDAACQAHDQCYQNAGVTGADIFNPARGPAKTAAINACDAQLCKRLTTIVPETRTENGDAFFVGLFFSVSHGSASACIP